MGIEFKKYFVLVGVFVLLWLKVSDKKQVVDRALLYFIPVS